MQDHQLIALDVPSTGIPPADDTSQNYINTVTTQGHEAVSYDTVKTTLITLGDRTLNILLFSAGIILVISIIIHSITLMGSGASESAQTTAKKGLTNAVIGMLIIFLTFVIANAIVNYLLPQP